MLEPDSSRCLFSRISFRYFCSARADSILVLCDNTFFNKQFPNKLFFSDDLFDFIFQHITPFHKDFAELLISLFFFVPFVDNVDGYLRRILNEDKNITNSINPPVCCENDIPRDIAIFRIDFIHKGYRIELRCNQVISKVLQLTDETQRICPSFKNILRGRKADTIRCIWRNRGSPADNIWFLKDLFRL